MHHKEPLHIYDAMSAFREGQDKGFSFFFDAWYHSLCLFCLRIINSHQLTEEIVGDSFIKAWERKENFTHPKALNSFLYTTCRNACLKWLRDEKRQNRKARDYDHLMIDPNKNMLQLMIASETYAEIYRAMKTLPPQCLKIFKMSFLEEKKADEIASELHLTPSAVRSQKTRGLRLLREKLNLPLWLLLFSAYFLNSF